MSFRRLESGATVQDILQIEFLLVHEMDQLHHVKGAAVRGCAHELQKGRVCCQASSADTR